MDAFLQRHAAEVTGTVSGWDRLRFRGTLRMLANVTGMGRFLSYTGHLLKDFGQYALRLSRQVRAASLAVAESAGRPVVHLDNPSVSKEDLARAIAQRDGVTDGLIAVLTAVELAANGQDAGTRAARKRAASAATRRVAAYLSNTPAVCRSAYIDPRVFDRYDSGETIRGPLKRIVAGSDPGEFPDRERIERAVLRLLK